MKEFVLLKDKEYPDLLKKIGSDSPKKLYYKGKWDTEIFKNCLAVVGSRQMTFYGKNVVTKIVSEVASAGITIVSGFMYGVDAQAHKTALDVGARTIAVMPCGIDIIHPEYQEDLYKKIVNNQGLIISEFEGNFLPSTWTYPRRNRIIAGLSKAVLVIEAGLKSGSLITANYAKKYNREIFAIPGQIFSENSKGTLQLIKQGATIVTSAEEIIKYFFENNLDIPKTQQILIPHQPNSKHSSNLSLEKQIIERLKKESLGIDDMSRLFGISVSKLGTTLSLMQLKNIIKQQGNKYYVN